MQYRSTFCAYTTHKKMLYGMSLIILYRWCKLSFSHRYHSEPLENQNMASNHIKRTFLRIHHFNYARSQSL